MPSGIWTLEFLNSNSQRRYPLTEDASGRDETASFQLPNEFLLEVDLPIHHGLDVSAARFFLMQLSVYAIGFQLVLGYQPAAGDAVAVATALIPRGTHTSGTMYTLGGIGDYADTLGKVVIGRLDAIDLQPAGQFNFTLGTARVEPDCVRPIVRGLSSIAVRSGSEISAKMYGDVELVAQENMQLTSVVVAGQNPQIRFSAIAGEGLAEICLCVGGDDGTPVRSINGVPPTADGNFTLLGNQCIEISPIKNGLKLTDGCSQPCCGCVELEAITQQLEQFGTRAVTLEGFINNVQSSVRQMEMIVLGSKLGDRGCVQCS